MLGYPGMCHFPGYTFCPKILKQDINFYPKILKWDINFEEKFLKKGNTLLGTRPTFFVERMT